MNPPESIWLQVAESGDDLEPPLDLLATIASTALAAPALAALSGDLVAAPRVPARGPMSAEAKAATAEVQAAAALAHACAQAHVMAGETVRAVAMCCLSVLAPVRCCVQPTPSGALR